MEVTTRRRSSCAQSSPHVWPREPERDTIAAAHDEDPLAKLRVLTPTERRAAEAARADQADARADEEATRANEEATHANEEAARAQQAEAEVARLRHLLEQRNHSNGKNGK